MEKVLGLLVLALGTLVKLIVTGACLAIGFRVGAKIAEILENSRKRKAITQVKPA